MPESVLNAKNTDLQTLVAAVNQNSQELKSLVSTLTNRNADEEKNYQGRSLQKIPTANKLVVQHPLLTSSIGLVTSEEINVAPQRNHSFFYKLSGYASGTVTVVIEARDVFGFWHIIDTISFTADGEDSSFIQHHFNFIRARVTAWTNGNVWCSVESA